ncbi:MAG TPA: tripartite tricarboxylate transporter TctB family protein [Candidatus Limnocylindrales bacterium]|nr:tripartite tricarboxylate transporter TctB family protein [Candidatus Limnocylindrales bacterium]
MHRDLAFGSATLVLSVAYYWTAVAIPEGQLADAVGPRGLPTTYALLLAALSLIVMVRSLARRRDPRPQEPAGPSPAAPSSAAPSHAAQRRVLWRVAGMLGMGIVYILVVPWLGYLFSIAALILATTYYQGGALNPRVAGVALCGGIFFWLLFVVMMGIPQPPGWWPPPL